MRTLVLHDYVTQKGGAERVAALLARDFGDGSLVTSAYSPNNAHDVFQSLVVNELAPWLPERAKTNRALLAPVAANAFSRYRPEADAIICSSSGWSHWIHTDSPSLVYCYTPPRWFWAPQDYFASAPRPLQPLISAALSPLRRQDVQHARQRTKYIAISTVSQRRIKEAYGIDADIVFPPVTLDPLAEQDEVPHLEPGYFLLIARPRGYKNTDALVELFRSKNAGTLVIVGGQQEGADPSGRVHRLGRVSDEALRWLYQNCGAVLALSHEDFGLTPIEGHMFGRPTIALRAGGYLDTCIEGTNAILVDSTEPEAVESGLAQFRATSFDEVAIKETAQRYSEAAFRARIIAALEEIIGS